MGRGLRIAGVDHTPVTNRYANRIEVPIAHRVAKDAGTGSCVIFFEPHAVLVVVAAERKLARESCSPNAPDVPHGCKGTVEEAIGRRLVEPPSGCLHLHGDDIRRLETW